MDNTTILVMAGIWLTGLSASVFTSLYLAFFQEDVIAYLLFLAVVPSATNLLFAFFINFVPFEQSGETPATTGAPANPFHLPACAGT